MSSRNLQFVLNLCSSEDQPARKEKLKQPCPSILNRLHKLPPSDQHLLNLAITGRHTFRQIATLVGSNPGSVCRRVTLLTRRLSHPLVIALLERPLGLSEKYIDIGLKRHLFHQGIRRIALQTDFPEREIRSTLHYLERWLRFSRELKDESAIRQPRPLHNRRGTNSVEPIAQHKKGECECATNP